MRFLRTWPNKRGAEDAAIPVLFHAGRHWRGASDPVVARRNTRHHVPDLDRYELLLVTQSAV
jgi:hypothetical protein